MPLKTENIEEPVLNLTPMIDIVFLLVIFFMVGSRFTEMERHYSVDLPTVSDALPLTSAPDEILVNIREDGQIFVGNQSKTAEELDAHLKAARENYPDQAVLIRADAEIPYQHVMNALAICHRAQIKNVSLANRLEREGEK